MKRKLYAGLLASGALFGIFAGSGFGNQKAKEEATKGSYNWTTMKLNDATYDIPVEKYDNGFEWVTLKSADLWWDINGAGTTQDPYYISIEGFNNPKFFRDVNVIFPSKLDYIDSNDVVHTDIPVTHIGRESFLKYENCETSSPVPGQEWSSIRGAIVPSTITQIDDKAFYCNDLSILDIAEGSELDTIGEKAFYFNFIEKLELPKDLTTIENEAFAWNGIEYLTTPMTTNVATSAFTNQTTNKTYKRVTINGGNIVPAGMFDGNTIGTLKIEEGISTIGNTAFRRTGITELDLPESLRTLSATAFGNNPIKKLTAGQYVVNNFEISAINTSIEELVVKPGTTSITRAYVGSGGGSSKGQLKKVTLPEGLLTIGTNAFNNNQLKELVLPDSLTTLGTGSFINNPINNLTIGAVVNTITNMEVIFKDLSANDMLNTLTLSEGVTTISNGLFRGSQRLVNNCTEEESGDLAHTSGYAIRNLTLPSSLKTIGQSAFRENRIRSVILGDNITSITKWAFNCNRINYFEAGTATDILTRNMYAQNGIAEVLIREGATRVNDDAFRNFVINKLTLPNSLVSIGEYAFLRNRLEHVKMGRDLETIGREAFSRNRIRAVDFNDKLTFIGHSAFKTNEITRLVLPESITEIKAYAFAFNSLEQMVMHSKVTKVEVGTFLYNKLTYVVVSETVTDIERIAFAWNRDLTTMYFKGDVAVGFDKMDDEIANPYHQTNLGRTSYVLGYVVPQPAPEAEQPIFDKDPEYTWTTVIIDNVINVSWPLGITFTGGFILFGFIGFAIKRKAGEKEWRKS